MFFTRWRLAVLAALALAAAACGSTASTTPSTAAEATDDHGSFTFGEPGDPAQADRVVEIQATDKLVFEPAELTVKAGETITFRIVNTGQIPHDFTLGDQTTQDEHEQAMTEMAGMTMPDEVNAMVVAAGETKELTWRFTEAGTFLIGCHQPGHYAAGMKGEITVEP